jgi:transposase
MSKTGLAGREGHLLLGILSGDGRSPQVMPVTGNTTAETSVVFIKQLREKHKEPLSVIWDNGPAHYGPEMREYLAMPDLQLRLVALPGYSPDFNPDEAIWAWVREEVTADISFCPAAKVREKWIPSSPGWLSAPTRSSSAAARDCKPRPMHS